MSSRKWKKKIWEEDIKNLSKDIFIKMLIVKWVKLLKLVTENTSLNTSTISLFYNIYNKVALSCLVFHNSWHSHFNVLRVAKKVWILSFWFILYEDICLYAMSPQTINTVATFFYLFFYFSTFPLQWRKFMYMTNIKDRKYGLSFVC